MARYRCDSCKEDRDDPVCIKCGANTRELKPAAGSLEQAAAGLRNAPLKEPVATVLPAGKTLFSAEPKRNVIEHPAAAKGVGVVGASAPGPEGAPEARTTPAPAAAPIIQGLDEFHALLDAGSKAIVICGGGGTGKSEIAAAFTRARNLIRGDAMVHTQRRAVLQIGYALGGTAPEEVWYQVIDGKRTFLDPSGEFFNRLNAQYRQQFGLPEIAENDFHFVQRAIQALAGVLLVVDLTKTVDARDPAAWRQQENDLNFVLAALRWIRWDREARPANIGYVVNIARRAKELPLIDKPVLVLFSKADQLKKLTNENPLHFAKRRLPVLHSAVMTHAKRFRYDFCHAMVRREGRDVPTDHPCGVLTPIEWMLDERFRWLPLQLPSRLLGGGK